MTIVNGRIVASSSLINSASNSKIAQDFTSELPALKNVVESILDNVEYHQMEVDGDATAIAVNNNEKFDRQGDDEEVMDEDLVYDENADHLLAEYGDDDYGEDDEYY